ncbi:hypothetical protein [Frigoribacterium faeni]|uniref:Uncharacterized protein n=1 Tax=Frigoribacterium faeni TaxID=145483 RepID=A0A7W3PI53_9MICO|nr:hypothetical protein [Frigoribacterium faeni]MBA8812653.1 hypothetical protein [Frigoribacterium faeni]BFF13763.1 hypothetical protein GCM10025699_50660 [Microbacterium flavescens]GEK82334.1 hypothetical protein FFA01_06430 [Frigoribacterium faeni]
MNDSWILINGEKIRSNARTIVQLTTVIAYLARKNITQILVIEGTDQDGRDIRQMVLVNAATQFSAHVGAETGGVFIPSMTPNVAEIFANMAAENAEDDQTDSSNQ